jgi:hypothetical protein
MRMGKAIPTALFCICLLFFSSLPVTASDWQYYISDRNGSRVFYDRESISRSDHMVMVQQKIIYNDHALSHIIERMGTRYEDLAEIVNSLEINCAEKQIKEKSITYVSSKGAVIDSRLHNVRHDRMQIGHKEELNILYDLCCFNEWLYVTSSADTDYLLSTASMKSSDISVSFWMKGTNRTSHEELERDKFIIRCTDGSYSLRYHIRYRKDKSSSIPIGVENNFSWLKIPPNTIIDSFQKLLCSGGQPRKDVRNYLITVMQK